MSTTAAASVLDVFETTHQIRDEAKANEKADDCSPQAINQLSKDPRIAENEELTDLMNQLPVW
jgi:hypothetical protein